MLIQIPLQQRAPLPQAALAEAGWSAKEVSAAFGTIASNGGDLKQARNYRVTIHHG